MPRIFTDEEVITIIRLRMVEGKPIRAVAKALRCDSHTLSAFCKTRKLMALPPGVRNHPAWKQLSPEKVSDLIALARLGTKKNELARIFGCDRSTIGYHLRKAGFTTKPLVREVKGFNSKTGFHLYYSPDEDNVIQTMVREGAQKKEIANALGRSPRSVERRILILGLRPAGFGAAADKAAERKTNTVLLRSKVCTS